MSYTVFIAVFEKFFDSIMIIGVEDCAKKSQPKIECKPISKPIVWKYLKNVTYLLLSRMCFFLQAGLKRKPKKLRLKCFTFPFPSLYSVKL